MTKFTDEDVKYMKLAFKLARKGLGKVSPNPLVGAVLVKDGEIIGKGYHQYYGGPHAEVNAINSAGDNVSGSTLYVTLEPCSSYGKTPPCIDKIVESKIKRVVVASRDPNPVNNSKGIKLLCKAGIKVDEGLLLDSAEDINRYYFHYICSKKPYVILKTAMSMDGKIATQTKESRWISCELSRKYVHILRKKVDAVLVGVKTVIKDNPELTSRINNKIVHPLKIVIDTRGEIPLDSKLLKRGFSCHTLVVLSEKISKKIRNDIESTGASTLIIKENRGRIDLLGLINKLGEIGVASLLIESGGELAFSVLREKIVNKLIYFYAPIILGGKDAPTGVDGEGISSLNNAMNVKIEKVKRMGLDVMVEGIPYTD
ncbi:bifunctional diaminohydroxyphosphoribosylaminopyrimidine deaminase/5-amino-6-(5-phosphoribosylamino)uracil reductase RibD [Chlamydiota bacterium]